MNQQYNQINYPDFLQSSPMNNTAFNYVDDEIADRIGNNDNNDFIQEQQFFDENFNIFNQENDDQIFQFAINQECPSYINNPINSDLFNDVAQNQENKIGNFNNQSFNGNNNNQKNNNNNNYNNNNNSMAQMNLKEQNEEFQLQQFIYGEDSNEEEKENISNILMSSHTLGKSQYYSAQKLFSNNNYDQKYEDIDKYLNDDQPKNNISNNNKQIIEDNNNMDSNSALNATPLQETQQIEIPLLNISLGVNSSSNVLEINTDENTNNIQDSSIKKIENPFNLNFKPKIKINNQKDCSQIKNICGNIIKKTIKEFSNKDYKDIVLIKYCQGDEDLYEDSIKLFRRNKNFFSGFKYFKLFMQESEPEDEFDYSNDCKRVFRQFMEWFLKERYIRYALKGNMDDKLLYIKYKNQVLLKFLNNPDAWNGNKLPKKSLQQKYKKN